MAELTPLDKIQGVMRPYDKDLVYEDMVNLIERLNYAFYVKGSAKDMRPIMAETKDLLKKARAHLGLGEMRDAK